MNNMKKYILFVFVASFVLFACKKEKATVNNGLPANILPDIISPALQLFMDTLLPEKHSLILTHPEYLSTTTIADLPIKQHSDVYITFVSQSSKYNNTLAFYTYPTNHPPLNISAVIDTNYIFPNCGATTSLQHGNKVKIGTFEAGTSIGFVLLVNGWNSDTHSVYDKGINFYSNDAFNPEADPNLKKHAVLISYKQENKVLIGFEDLNRTDPNCDGDFNDLLVYCTLIQ